MTQGATLLRQVAALWRNLFQNRLVGGLEECAFSATVEGQVIMSRRAIFSLAVSVIIGIGCVAMVSTDAFAYRGGGRAGVGRAGAYHGGVHRAGAYRGGVPR